ncbi:unnamed protein product [Cuscuta campestris]|uniref:AP2/ERF domain-containing protein n=1 Tax=Cuscuta campestris TaxID=132261 RepID=A0A484LF27_9ASTE|nr:unnamed protein product [Cuscuta campestris]
MKFMNDHHHINAANNNSHLLGFSLSPALKMEADHGGAPSACSMASSFYLSPPPGSLCYPVAEAGGFHSPLSLMTLKSDGSLCLMEALSRSQTHGMVSNTSPKLENFLGGATMADSTQYGRETSALSLDSMYYPQTRQGVENHGRALSFHLHPQTHHSNYYYNNLQSQEMAGNELKNWVSVGHFGQDAPVISPAAGGAGGVLNCNDFQPLSLSMSPGSQSSCVTAAPPVSQISPTDLECVAMEGRKRVSEEVTTPKQPIHRKSIDTFGQRTSQYRGVTRHRWTGRYEAHLWDNSCKKEGQTRKGRQVYLGGYDMEEKAARAYDLAALKYWGPSTHVNSPLENYQKELEEMKNMTRQEYVAHLRRKSSGFSRGASMYRGVTRHHQHGRWQARIGRVAGNKDLYLGTFSTQEEAAEAYDIAAIKFRGVTAVTNFDMSRYDVQKILAGNSLPSGEVARRNKDRDPAASAAEGGNLLLALPEDWRLSGGGEEEKQCLSVAAMQSLIGMETNKMMMMMSCQLSNPSSAVTSLSSSREDSPAPNNHPQAAAAALRPVVPSSMPNFPLFAAWNES